MKYKLYFDGGCRGGKAKAAWILEDSGGNPIAKCTKDVIGEGTNNIAEWDAVWSGIQYVVTELSDKEIELKIVGDSQLVIYQLIGKYQCKKPELQVYHQKCLDLLAKITWIAEWVPRNENTKANALCDGSKGGGKKRQPRPTGTEDWLGEC